MGDEGKRRGGSGSWSLWELSAATAAALSCAGQFQDGAFE